LHAFQVQGVQVLSGNDVLVHDTPFSGFYSLRHADEDTSLQESRKMACTAKYK